VLGLPVRHELLHRKGTVCVLRLVGLELGLLLGGLLLGGLLLGGLLLGGLLLGGLLLGGLLLGGLLLGLLLLLGLKLRLVTGRAGVATPEKAL